MGVLLQSVRELLHEPPYKVPSAMLGARSSSMSLTHAASCPIDTDALNTTVSLRLSPSVLRSEMAASLIIWQSFPRGHELVNSFHSLSFIIVVNGAVA